MATAEQQAYEVHNFINRYKEAQDAVEDADVVTPGAKKHLKDMEKELHNHPIIQESIQTHKHAYNLAHWTINGKLAPSEKEYRLKRDIDAYFDKIKDTPPLTHFAELLRNPELTARVTLYLQNGFRF